MHDDPIVAEVRKAREELSARFNFDVKAIFADLRKRQALVGSRLVSPKKRNTPARLNEDQERPAAESRGAAGVPI